MITSNSLVRNINRKRVVQQVFNHMVISRSQIAKNLELNKVTVSEIVGELVEQHYFTELGKGMGSNRGGRKPTMLEFNANYGFVISFDLGYGYIDAMVARVDGQMMQYAHHEMPNIGIAQRIDYILTEIQRLSIGVGTTYGLIGVSIAIQGIVKDNRVLYSPYLDFKDIDIARIIQRETGVPTAVQNEANLAVIYERDFECPTGINNLVCISVHKGIGAGIILNNSLYTGLTGEAGEIGHSLIYESPITRNSARVSIEKYCSEDAIMKRVKKETNLEYLSPGSLKQMFNEKNPIVTDIMNDFCFYMANIIHSLIITLDPEKVVINSNLVAEIPALLEQIRGEIPYLTTHETTVTLSGNSRYAILLGGVSVIVNEVLGTSLGELNFVSRQNVN